MLRVPVPRFFHAATEAVSKEHVCIGFQITLDTHCGDSKKPPGGRDPRLKIIQKM
jgi:hypothetical protein